MNMRVKLADLRCGDRFFEGSTEYEAMADAGHDDTWVWLQARNVETGMPEAITMNKAQPWTWPHLRRKEAAV